jgi:hypothetical protein
MVAVTGDMPALVAVKDAMFPLPLVPKPIEVLLFVHAYVTVPPVAGLLKLTALVNEPAHTTWLATAVTVATGFIVIVNVIGKPPQLVGAEGVTVIVATCGLLVVLDVVNDGIFPLPLAPNPIAVLLFVQL